ncbi:hypothetical protein AKG36_04585 [Trueperella bernardiae]|nr:hypothetical protein AKG36_04585 [Trueperella bernardiae]
MGCGRPPSQRRRVRRRSARPTAARPPRRGPPSLPGRWRRGRRGGRRRCGSYRAGSQSCRYSLTLRWALPGGPVYFRSHLAGRSTPVRRAGFRMRRWLST